MGLEMSASAKSQVAPIKHKMWNSWESRYAQVRLLSLRVGNVGMELMEQGMGVNLTKWDLMVTMYMVPDNLIAKRPFNKTKWRKRSHIDNPKYFGQMLCCYYCSTFKLSGTWLLV